MITAKMAREKAQLLGKIEQEITTAAESGYLDTTTQDFYTDDEFKTISAILTQAGFLCTKLECIDKKIINTKYGVPAYNIFISWEKEQVIPR